MSSNTQLALWALFDDMSAQPQQKRLRAVLGVLALEAELALFWRGHMLSQWDAVLSLIAQNPPTPAAFTRGQWTATLAYFRALRPEGAPPPSLCDMAALLHLARSDDVRTPEFAAFCAALLHLQRVRGDVVDLSRECADTRIKDVLRLVEECRVELPKYLGRTPITRSTAHKLAA